MRQLLLDEVRRSVRAAFPDVGADVLERLTLDPPPGPSNGDFATNAAFVLKGHVRSDPRRIAEAIVTGLPATWTDVEIAGAGFINFRVRPEGIHAFLRRLADAGARAEMLQDAAL